MMIFWGDIYSVIQGLLMAMDNSFMENKTIEKPLTEFDDNELFFEMFSLHLMLAGFDKKLGKLKEMSMITVDSLTELNQVLFEKKYGS